MKDKYEWEFDGTRGDFWTFTTLAVFSLVFLVANARNLFWGYHPDVTKNWIDWLVVVTSPFLAITFFKVEKILGIGVGLVVVDGILKLVITRTTGSAASLLDVRNVVNVLIWLFTSVGLGLYLKHHLRRVAIRAAERRIEE